MGTSKTAAIILGLALIIAACLVTGPLRDLAASRASLTVKGFAERKIESDLAVVTVVLASRGKTLREANERLREGEKRVREVFRIAQPGMEEGPVQMNPQHRLDARGNPTADIEFYEITRCFKARLRNVEQAADLNRSLENLVAEGLEANLSPIEYLCTDLAGWKADLLQEAMKDARLRAEKMAGHGGRKLGRILSAQQGVFQLTDPYSTEVSALGVLDTGSKAKSLKATVTVQFQLR
ncbi:MAG: SIMPL domain-containing protein [Verrucomicrobia bacterium]|nr:SIMPL domain-containing protein [Verrucomicrobiota bacterium]